MDEYKNLYNCVIAELYALDKKAYVIKLFLKNIEWSEYGSPQHKRTKSCCFSSDGTKLGVQFYYDCAFGRLTYKKEKVIKKIEDYKLPIHLANENKYTRRCGIEVLGMKPERTKDGKYTYKGNTITELKECCKKNGLKGYSGKDKCELVAMLMKL